MHARTTRCSMQACIAVLLLLLLLLLRWRCGVAALAVLNAFSCSKQQWVTCMSAALSISGSSESMRHAIKVLGHACCSCMGGSAAVQLYSTCAFSLAGANLIAAENAGQLVVPQAYFTCAASYSVAVFLMHHNQLLCI